MTEDNSFEIDKETDDLLKAHEHVFAMKDQIAGILHGHASNDCYLALRMMIVQFLCDTCTTKEFAVEMLADMAGSSLTIISSMDEMGACAWNKVDKKLQ